MILDESNTPNRLPEAGAILGEFRLGERLGSGGFAVVFRAVQQRLEREVAVKVLTPAAVTDTDLPQRFLREIDLVKRLEHPNIVRLYDFGQTENGLLWMAMELVRGEELQDIINNAGQLSLRRAKSIGLQILSGLAEAHEQSIVHRDLKPGNIMLTKKGAQRDLVKLLDFGVGKALGEDESSVIHNLTTTQGGTYGTPRYMAPEQLKNAEMGPHTDVYAAGLILYEMISGQPAVSGSTTYEVLVKQISQVVELPPWLDGTPLGHLIAKATAKNWSDRYADALEFYEALESVDVDQIEQKRKQAVGLSPSNTPNSPVVLRDSGRIGDDVPSATGQVPGGLVSTADVTSDAEALQKRPLPLGIIAAAAIFVFVIVMVIATIAGKEDAAPETPESPAANDNGPTSNPVVTAQKPEPAEPKVAAQADPEPIGPQLPASVAPAAGSSGASGALGAVLYPAAQAAALTPEGDKKGSHRDRRHRNKDKAGKDKAGKDKAGKDKGGKDKDGKDKGGKSPFDIKHH